MNKELMILLLLFLIVCEGIGKAEPFSVVVHNTVHIWEEILKARKIMKKLLKRISNIKIIEEDFMDLLW